MPNIYGLLPTPITIRLKRVRDTLRFRRIGLETVPYSGPLQCMGSTYGGYVLPKDEVCEGAICYSFGAGEDISFETELATALHVEVHVFDPTPRAIQYVSAVQEKFSKDNHRGSLHFHPWGVWSSDQQMKFYAPADPTHVSHSLLNIQHTSDYFLADCRRPLSILHALGHEKVAIVKLNIEGAEYEVMRAIFEDQITPQVICINFDELHLQIDGRARTRLRNLVKQFADQEYRAVSAQACRATFVRSSARGLRGGVHDFSSP